MIEITLTTWERLMCETIIGAQNGKTAQIRIFSKLLDQLEFSSVESQAIGLHLQDHGMAWRDQERVWNFSFDTRLMQALVNAVREWPNWKARDYKRVEELNKKLGLSEPA